MHHLLIIDNVADKPGFQYPCNLDHQQFRAKSNLRLKEFAQYLGDNTQVSFLTAEEQDQSSFARHLNDTQYTGIVLSGSPYHVDEDQPWIRALQKALTLYLLNTHKKPPLLGICFGTQIIAHILGGQVRRLDKAKQGQSSFTLKDGQTVPSYVFHQDYIKELPTGATLLAESQEHLPYFMQFNTHVWGVQTHPEIPLLNEADQEQSRAFWKTFLNQTF